MLKHLFFYGYQWRRTVRRHLKKYYSPDKPKSNSLEKTVICMADGKLRHGGLADRIRSYVTYYNFCKSHNLRFAINFTFPFRLEDYLEPNIYDWRLRPGELTYNSSEARPLPFSTSGPLTKFEIKKQRQLVEKYVGRGRLKQYHIYSNFCFYDDNFGKCFHELFRPVPRIAKAVEECKKEIGGKYISVATRFLELLGDFKEPKDRMHLSEEGKEELIRRCMHELNNIHKQYPNHTILVTSDSMLFLDSCRNLPFVYIPSGTIKHLDLAGTGDHAKTFIDFLLISEADKVFQIKVAPMYEGNFSLRAAQVGEKPYQLIEA